MLQFERALVQPEKSLDGDLIMSGLVMDNTESRIFDRLSCVHNICGETILAYKQIRAVQW